MEVSPEALQALPSIVTRDGPYSHELGKDEPPSFTDGRTESQTGQVT